VILVASLTGCLGTDTVLSSGPSVTVENQSDVTYTVTVTTIHTDDPVGTLLLQLTYADGSDSAVPYRESAVGNQFSVSENVTAVEVVGTEQSSLTVTLDPGMERTPELTEWQSGDVVMLTWTNVDRGTVEKVTTISCRSGNIEYGSTVDSASGSGSGFSSC
jgi:hypothetical protein